MDFNRDELRRQLRDAEREQRSAMVGFRDALHRIFHATDIPTAAKAELLGAPDRRSFLKIGGVTVIGAAVLAACGSDEKKGVAETGTTLPTTTTAPGATTTPPTTEGADAAATDITLTKTAASLENLAVALYGVALGQSDTKLPVEVTFDPAVADAAKLFQSHHQAHADALNSVLKGAGEPEYTDVNKYLFDNVVAKTLPGLTDQAKVVMFAREIENVAASTYSFAAGVLSKPKLRQTLMSIGGVESRHATALALVLDPSGADAVPRPFVDSGPQGRVPDEALIK